MEKLRFFKATGPGGLAHYDGKTRYAVGERLSIADPAPASAGACGRGLHVVARLTDISGYVSAGDLKRAEFYEVEVDAGDVIAADTTKTRVRSLKVLRRVSEQDLGIRRGSLAALVGSGSGSGYGDGSGSGSGYGYGYGDGYGSGDGSGSGYGSGDGSGYGSGD